MTARSELFDAFARLHDPESPLVLRNIWDAGGAKAVAGHGAAAIAASSWPVAASHGYADGETLPFELVVANTRRITGCVDIGELGTSKASQFAAQARRHVGFHPASAAFWKWVDPSTGSICGHSHRCDWKAVRA